MRRPLAAFLVSLACATIFSCARAEVHVHDRHGLSFPVVESYAKGHPGTTLVLIDYHHDVGPDTGAVTSYNWVGKLLAEGSLGTVIWVSGRDLLLPNRNARIAWLRRKLASFSPSEAAAIESRVTLADWHELETRHRLAGPLVVSVDLDVLCHDPGSPPERFLDEIGAWIGKQRPDLVTIALSAAYQKAPSEAWPWLGRIARDLGPGAARARWFLEAGERSLGTEGAEEAEAWWTWASDTEAFGRRDSCFQPGAAMWISPPPGLRKELLELGIRAGDPAAEDMLSGWADADRLALEESFSRADTDGALAAAASAIEAYWGKQETTGPRTMPAPGGAAEFGLALRILGKEGDRGCLALYRGVHDLHGAVTECARAAADDPRYPLLSSREREELDLELSIFGPWKGMASPTDFRPGIDSLLLIDGKEVTLLQAPVAAERGYGREEFLARLSRKAGLGESGWRREGLRFMRSATIWSRRDLESIEAGPDYQKYVKK